MFSPKPRPPRPRPPLPQTGGGMRQGGATTHLLEQALRRHTTHSLPQRALLSHIAQRLWLFPATACALSPAPTHYFLAQCTINPGHRVYHNTWFIG